MPVKMLFAFAGIMSWCVLAHAQTPTVDCVPVQGQGWQGCAPIGNSQQPQQREPPPPRWADRWGAIASANPGSPPAFGASNNRPSEDSAKKSALADCRATPNAKCSVETTYHNQCFAEVWGEKTPVSSTGGSLAAAIKASMEYCRAKGNTQCKLYYSACSYPVRIQ